MINKNIIIFILLTIFIIILDQSSKIFIEHQMAVGQSIQIVKDIICITFVHNKAGAFSIPISNKIFYIITSTIAIVLIILYYIKIGQTSNYYSSSLGLILGGAIGNLADRLRLGMVIDFIDIGIDNNSRWPVFNVADIAVTIGILILILFTIVYKVKPVPDESLSNNSIDSRELENS